MGKNKLKLLYVLDIMKQTDEQHPLTAKKIAVKLKNCGIDAEYKSVIRDIKTLAEYGYDIILHHDNKLGYYMASREFEDWELKILCDAVAGAKFLTRADTDRLIKKLQALSSSYGNKVLRSSGRIDAVLKNSSPLTKVNIDLILRAIKSGRQIEFRYVTVDNTMKRVFRKDGRIYKVSPYALFWRNDNYYLVGNYSGYDDLSHYRLDRMAELAVSEDRARPAEEIVGANPSEAISEHIKKAQYSYVGETISLTLEFEENIADDLIDCFGNDIKIVRCNDKYRLTVRTEESSGLYYLLLQYGEYVTVISPERVRKEMLRRIEKIGSRYE
ncbi:MAG: helix-turn-helix transcriptional regulator [Oscillospiraceae bacterium]